jgi:SIR2-like domain
VLDQLLQLLARAFGDHLDGAAVRQVANVAGEAKEAGAVLDVVSKADALHAAADDGADGGEVVDAFWICPYNPIHMNSKLNARIIESNLVVLTGAGASAPLNLYTTVEFMRHVERTLGSEAKYERPLVRVLNFVNPWKGMETIDIEVVIDHLNAVLEAADTLGRDVFFSQDIFKNSGVIDQHLKAYEALRARILDEVVSHYSALDQPLATRLYGPFLEELVELENERTLPFFTLNYDLSLETAVEGIDGFTLHDGINRSRVVRRWSRTVFDRFSPSQGGGDLILFKLHGSVSWCGRSGDITEIHGVSRNPAPLGHVILYPSLRYKNLQEDPFKAAYEYLSGCLSHAKTALIIGSTLRDAELVEVIRTGVLQNANLTLVCLNQKQSAEPFLRRLECPLVVSWL